MPRYPGGLHVRSKESGGTALKLRFMGAPDAVASMLSSIPETGAQENPANASTSISSIALAAVVLDGVVLAAIVLDSIVGVVLATADPALFLLPKTRVFLGGERCIVDFMFCTPFVPFFFLSRFFLLLFYSIYKNLWVICSRFFADLLVVLGAGVPAVFLLVA